MSSNHNFPFVDPCSCYFVTFSVVSWIAIFKLEKPLQIIIDSLQFVQTNHNLAVYAYVIMPDHLHMIVADKNFDNIRLHKALTSFRKFTGANIIRFIEKEAPIFLPFLETHHLGDRKRIFWQEGWHAEAIYSDTFYDQKVDYIHNNPMKAGLVDLPEDYLYSSAKTILFNKPGLIKISYF